MRSRNLISTGVIAWALVMVGRRPHWPPRALMAVATRSSLNATRSSVLPPPRLLIYGVSPTARALVRPGEDEPAPRAATGRPGAGIPAGV